MEIKIILKGQEKIKNIKRILSIIMAVVIIMSSNITVFASNSHENKIEMLEKNKEIALASIYEQLRDQGKENMYYLFEKVIEDEYEEVRISTLNDYTSEKSFDLIQPMSKTGSHNRPNGGTIIYTTYSGRVTVSKVGMTLSQTNEAFNGYALEGSRGFFSFILSMISLPYEWPRIFSTYVFLNSYVSDSQWREVRNGTGRALTTTIKDPLEGEATVVSDWIGYPYITANNYDKIISY